MNFDTSIFPAKLSWPDAVNNLDKVDSKEKIIRLVSGAKKIDLLIKLEGLKRLWCFDINEKHLEIIGKCKSIEQLYIENLKSDRLSIFTDLPNLKVLSIDTCSKVKTLDALGNLVNLQGLSIIHFSKISDINPLSRLNNLRELAIAGSMWKRMKIQSFKPLERLKNLEFLHLTNIMPVDDSLKPFQNLKTLKQLDLANFYPMEDFAKLAGILSKTSCTWFKPYINTSFSSCKKCGKETIVMLTGRRKPSLCSKCDTKRLNKHVAEFERIMKNSTQHQWAVADSVPARQSPVVRR